MGGGMRGGSTQAGALGEQGETGGEERGCEIRGRRGSDREWRRGRRKGKPEGREKREDGAQLQGGPICVGREGRRTRVNVATLGSTNINT